MPPYRLLPCGDMAVTLEIGTAIDPALSEQILAIDAALQARALPGIIETVPTYRSLLIRFEPTVIDFETLGVELAALEPATVALAARLFRFPVCYDPAFGEDLGVVTAATGLSVEEIVARHGAAEYRVYMIGFAPGFTYLGGLDPSLFVSRRSAPRLRVPSGSVMIGGEQAGIMGVAMPSGWHILGLTPYRLFDLDAAEPFLLGPGDRLRFHPVDRAEFERLREAVEREGLRPSPELAAI